MKNKKWIINSPIYVHWKKHYCKSCNSELIVKRTRKTVNARSMEAKDFDFSFSGGDGEHLFGDVEFSYEVFCCPVCNTDFSISEMKKHERELKIVSKKEKNKVV